MTIGSSSPAEGLYQVDVTRAARRFFIERHHTVPVVMDDIERRPPRSAYDAESRPRDMSTCTDAWLIEAVRGEPLDESALDILARRHWRGLFGRCRMLTLDNDDASDLAQSAWVRVLRARRSLDPQGNFAGYLTTVATNLWRDGHRSARRAGLVSDRTMASLDAPSVNGELDAPAFGDLLPDPNALPAEDQTLLAMEIDDALSRLAPRSRDVLVSRYLHGESAAEIAQRYGRTEQSITSWLRAAISEMKVHLGQSRRVFAREDGT
ncbi:MAG: sigma-70 family RNA polymerase sigma factor [bacterium]